MTDQPTPPPEPAPAPPAGEPLKEPAASLARAEAAARAKRYGEADGICHDVLRAFPNHAGAMALRGFVAARMGNVRRAITFLEPAVAAVPNNGTWQSVLADLYRAVYRLDEAMKHAREAIRLDPRRAGNFVNFAKVLLDRGEADDALNYLFRALALAPEDANAHLAMGQILLARRDFRPGWIEYEWRNKLEQAKGRFPPISAPIWNGMTHKNAKILLLGDQGFGDTIQFSRYIPTVAERCSEVVLACSEELKPLLAPMRGVGSCYHRWADVPGFTAYALLSSLPGILGTEPETIPAEIPYLAADPERAAAWRARLDEQAAPGIRVGLFWSGRPTHPNNLRRSLPLAQYAGIAKTPGISWISLQKEVPPSDRGTFAEFPGFLDLSADLANFGETAAVIGNLDLVITVDSAVAHLSGALGKPIWMLTPTPADWRWQLDRTDSPWYPSMRLFRQPRPGAWDAVFAEVTAALPDFRPARGEPAAAASDR